MELVEPAATVATFDPLGTVDGWIDEQVAAGVTHSEAMAILRRDHHWLWTAWMRQVADNRPSAGVRRKRERPRKRRARKAVGDEQRS